MKIATAAYPFDWFSSWSQYEDKLARWVSDAATQGAELLVFPEYGAMELASLDGADVASDLAQSIRSVSDKIQEVDVLHATLAAEYGVWILAASAPVVIPESRAVNRARLIAPSGAIGVQDKQIMTRFERETWDIAPGGPLRVFDTPFGKIGILICYDCEFPLLANGLSECDLILVPSCTEALAGYWRVRIGAMARALEQQCITIMSSTVGMAPWCPAVDENMGAGGIFCPPDKGFPGTGVLAEGVLNHPGWTYGEVDLTKIAEVRRDGNVLNRAHWPEQLPRTQGIKTLKLG